MQPADSLRPSDIAVVARYLHLRAFLNDRFLARVERLILDRYAVRPTRRVHSTLVALVRTGFVRPDEGELWPVIYMTTVDITAALCVELSAERVAALGTTVNGPTRIRHRGWEDWWGWEKPLSQLQPGFCDLPTDKQEETFSTWFAEGLEWLASSALLKRKA